MAERQVTASGKDKDGDITALCNKAASWSPRKKADAIKDIEDKVHIYYVGTGPRRTVVRVVKGQSGKYLRSTADGSTHNNLDDLPDC